MTLSQLPKMRQIAQGWHCNFSLDAAARVNFGARSASESWNILVVGVALDPCHL